MTEWFWLILAVAGAGVVIVGGLLWRWDRDLTQLRRDQAEELARLDALRSQQETRQREWIERLLATTERNAELAAQSTRIAAAVVAPLARLTPARREALTQAVIRAFPGEAGKRDLKTLMRACGAEQGVESVDWAGVTPDVVDQLLAWVESRDLLPAFIQAARAANPTNDLLRRWEAGG